MGGGVNLPNEVTENERLATPPTGLPPYHRFIWWHVRGVGGWVRVHGLGKEVVVTAGSALGAFAKSSK